MFFEIPEMRISFSAMDDLIYPVQKTQRAFKPGRIYLRGWLITGVIGSRRAVQCFRILVIIRLNSRIIELPKLRSSQSIGSGHFWAGDYFKGTNAAFDLEDCYLLMYQIVMTF